MADLITDVLAAREAQVAEYSQYVAATEIRNATGVVVYGARFPVPAGNVLPDGSIILLRHACPGVDPITGEVCSVEHNAVLEKTAPGMAVKVAKSAPARASKGSE